MLKKDKSSFAGNVWQVRLGMLLLMSMGCSPALFAKKAAVSKKPVIVAYVFEKDHVIQPGEIAAGKLTRINYAFANVADGKVVEGFPSDAQNYAALVALKQVNPSLTILASVGGWTWSGNFSDAVVDKKSRARFAESAVDFVKKYNLDGLDVDWEFPGMVGMGNRFRPEDKQNYTLMLKEIRKQFNREEKKLHRPLYLTVATGSSTKFLEHTEMGKVQKYVDTVNLMAYDYYGEGDKVTGHHAPLFTDPADPKSISADRSIREYEQAGVPAGKIVLGVPFYGRAWGEVSDVNHGLFQPGTRIANGYGRYSVVSQMLNEGFSRYWDTVASAPYLYSPTKKVFVSYEDPESLALKCRYVLDKKLGGIMFWEYNSDPSGTLLDAVDVGLYRTSSGVQIGAK